MPYKVLIVDDSSFFQMRLKEIVNEHPDLTVIGVASNGQEAVDMEESLRPDIISMDYEMPFLDGVSAVRLIMAKRKIPIVMLSSMTYEGARITLEALDAGAVDFMPKNFAEVSKNSTQLKNRLHEKLLTFAKSAHPEPISTTPVRSSAPLQTPTPASRVAARPIFSSSPSMPPPMSRIGMNLKGKVKIVVIGASTGGPVAITEIITKLPSDFPAPVVVVQHMPENFTKAFAERLDRQSQLSVREAESGMQIERGCVYVAPGGIQTVFDRGGKALKLMHGDDRINYKPSVDIAFASVANAYGSGVLGVILTGMGADGCEGARVLKEKGSAIWSQDEASCVVYGMPAAVANAKLTDAVLPLGGVAGKLVSDI